MPALPISTISSFRTSFSPFSPLSKPCRLFLAMIQTPTTLPPNSARHIKVTVKRLPRDSKELPEMTVGFRNGEELRLEVGKTGMKFDDAVEEVGRIGRVIAREAALKD